MARKSYIDFTERNRYGAVVIWGAIGIRQYYFMNEREARKRYNEEARNTVLTNN